MRCSLNYLRDGAIHHGAYGHPLASAHAGYSHVVLAMVPRASHLIDQHPLVVEYLHSALKRQRADLRLVLLRRVSGCLGVVQLREVGHRVVVVPVPFGVPVPVEYAAWLLLDVVRVLRVERDSRLLLAVACATRTIVNKLVVLRVTLSTEVDRVPASWNKIGLGKGSLPLTFLKAITIMLTPSYGLLISYVLSLKTSTDSGLFQFTQLVSLPPL